MDESVNKPVDMRDYLMARRQALLLELDLLEQLLKIYPRVSELRKAAKHEQHGKENVYNHTD